MRYHFRMREVARWYLVVWLVLSGAWTALTEPVALLIFAAAAASTILLPAALPEPFWRFPKEKPRLGNLAAGLLPLMPPLLYFIHSQTPEMPFMGDHVHHQYTLLKVILVYTPLVGLPLLALLVAIQVSHSTRSPATPWLLLALLAAGAWLFPVNPAFLGRYPSGLYVLASTFAKAGRVHPVTALELTNLLGPVAYLWVLRPALLGAWPDRRSLWIGAWFLQRDFLYYFTSAYIEPWSLVFLALALEAAALRLGPLSLLLAGTACAFKDQAVLFLPLFVLLAPAPRARNFVYGALAAAPFGIYLFLRRMFGEVRPIELAAGKLGSADLWKEYAFRIHEQLGTASLIALAALAACSAFLAIRHRSPRALGPLAYAALVEVFFLSDRLGQNWPGYSRYRLYTWLLLGALPLFWPRESPRLGRALLAVLAISFVPGAVSLWRMSVEGTEYQRNFFEHYDSPVFFPMHALDERIPATPKPLRLVVNDPLQEDTLYWGLLTSYPEILSRFELAYRHLAAAPPVCSCRDLTEADGIVLLSVIRDRNLSLRRPPSMPADPGEPCLEALRRSCSRVETIRTAEGALWGAVGLR